MKKIFLILILMLPIIVLGDDDEKYENLKLKEEIRKLEKNYNDRIKELNSYINNLNQKISNQNSQIDFLGEIINDNNSKYLNEINKLNILLEEKSKEIKKLKERKEEIIVKPKRDYKNIISAIIVILILLIIVIWKKMSHQNKFYFCRKENK